MEQGLHLLTLRTDELDFDLPEELIAAEPLERRDAARMMVVRVRSRSLEHRHVCDLPAVLRKGDLLVLNDTRVLPARLVGQRSDTGGKIDGLFIKEETRGRWRVMLRAGGPLRPGTVIQLRPSTGCDTDVASTELLSLKLVTKDEVRGEWIVSIESSHGKCASDVLERFGWTALPPYIIRRRREIHDQGPGEAVDRTHYQTVFAQREGSIAAPTAGLHFTPALLATLQDSGIDCAPITLHVGLGTFKPVKTQTIDEHPMHSEHFEVPASTCRSLQSVHRRSGRIIAVGTTTARALESLPAVLSPDSEGPCVGETNLKILPGHEFHWVDGLLTNFHLPRTTLLALVASMTGPHLWKEAYALAIRESYRFFSFGDCMIILPD